MSQIRPFVAYYRVSTDKQGRSGLGLDAQVNSVQQYITRSGGEMLNAFQEVETGKYNDRPELQKALKLCRQKKAVLIIAKLDRLSRNSAFINNLLESDVDFVACDMPTANKLTIRIMAAIAEHEREAISIRTKEALQAAKARGQKLGNPSPALLKMRGQWTENTQAYRAKVYPLIKQLRDRGMTLRAIAEHLNETGIRSPNHRLWHMEAVRLVLLRHEEGVIIQEAATY